MKKLAILIVLALILAISGCGSRTLNNTPTNTTTSGNWEAKLTGGVGAASQLNFVTSFTVTDNGTGNNLALDITGFNFFNTNTGTCFINGIDASTETGLLVGDCRVAHLGRARFEKMVAEKVLTPWAARNFVKVLRTLMRFAIANGYRTDDPTAGAKMPRIRTDGYASWGEEHIATFEACHYVGTRARLAFALLLFSAQRRRDVVIMGRQHLRSGYLHIRQHKTGVELAIPLHPQLRAILDATPTNMTFLTTDAGKPFSAAGFGNLFRDWCNKAGLPKGLSAHGLRKAACRRLAELGCSANQIMAISGHRSLSEAEKYVRAADQKRLADAAIGTLVAAFPGDGAGTSIGKPE